jgi:hypothetical protein
MGELGLMGIGNTVHNDMVCRVPGPLRLLAPLQKICFCVFCIKNVFCAFCTKKCFCAFCTKNVFVLSLQKCFCAFCTKNVSVLSLQKKCFLCFLYKKCFCAFFSLQKNFFRKESHRKDQIFGGAFLLWHS